jgi:UDP-N-acetylglucosamine acyltransferase
VGDHVTVSGNAAMGGHCHIFEGANIGLNVSIHQYSVIGHYAMIGMGTVITKKSVIEPVKTYIGNPAKFLKVNQYAIDKNGLSIKQIDAFNTEFHERLASK